MGKDLIEVDFECGPYFGFDEYVPECGDSFQKAVVSAIFPIDAKNAKERLCILKMKVVNSRGDQNLVFYALSVSFGENVKFHIFQAT